MHNGPKEQVWKAVGTTALQLDAHGQWNIFASHLIQLQSENSRPVTLRDDATSYETITQFMGFDHPILRNMHGQGEGDSDPIGKGHNRS